MHKVKLKMLNVPLSVSAWHDSEVIKHVVKYPIYSIYIFNLRMEESVVFI